jgi:methylmalonyl-CoA mutase
METMYQRGKIQDESMEYEHRKHDGSLPIIGVNTFIDAAANEANGTTLDLVRSSAEQKQQQIDAVNQLHEFHHQQAPQALATLQQHAVEGKNTFGLLMEAVKCSSLGQISAALYEVGGEYRRSM